MIASGKDFYENLISESFKASGSPAASLDKPKAIIVMGGPGSGKTQVVGKLNKSLKAMCLNTHFFKERLAKVQDTNHSYSAKGVLEKKAVSIRDEAFYYSILNKKNIILESSEDSNSIQTKIDALKKNGYEIELHLVDTDENVAMNRIAVRNDESRDQVPVSSVKKLNRKAKTNFLILKKENYEKITAHRWSGNDEIPQLDDQERINKCFEKFIIGLQADREKLYSGLNSQDQKIEHLQKHLNSLTALSEIKENERNPHALLMAIITDITMFPEIYLNHRKELAELYNLVDKNDFHAYYTSIRRNGPAKSHGSVIIGSPTLAQGISFAAAGEQRRGAIKLPTEFREKLIVKLQDKDNDFNKIIMTSEFNKKFGSVKNIVEALEEDEGLYDSYSLYTLIEKAAPDLLNEYLKIQFNVRDFNKKFELWNKPRSSLQNQDTKKFNAQFTTFLKEKSNSIISRAIGHLHHGLTRSVGIREQSHVSASTVIKRWLEIEAHKKDIDKRRKLKYEAEPDVWHFDPGTTSIRGGNCNTISAALLGANPETASMFNIGTSKGAKYSVSNPSQHDEILFRDSRTGNKYADMLFESHIAKLVVHHPFTYQNSVMKINAKIKEFLPRLNEEKKQYLANEIKSVFKEFDLSKDDPIQFMQKMLESTDPKNLFRCILFHKNFFEQLFTPDLTGQVKMRIEYYQMRPAHLFSGAARGKESNKEQLEFHDGIGGMRLHDVNHLNLHEDSFNTLTTQVPASCYNLFAERDKRFQGDIAAYEEAIPNQTAFKDQVIKDDALFYGGTSGSMTTKLPYIFNTILKDDPLAQEDYLLASIAAMSYAGHHSMFEAVSPLKYMRGDICPERFKNIRANDPNFYDKILTQRFKEYIHRKADGQQSSLYEQCMKEYETDLVTMNTALKEKVTRITSKSTPSQETQPVTVITNEKDKQVIKSSDQTTSARNDKKFSGENTEKIFNKKKSMVASLLQQEMNRLIKKYKLEPVMENKIVIGAKSELNDETTAIAINRVEKIGQLVAKITEKKKDDAHLFANEFSAEDLHKELMLLKSNMKSTGKWFGKFTHTSQFFKGNKSNIDEALKLVSTNISERFIRRFKKSA